MKGRAFEGPAFGFDLLLLEDELACNLHVAITAFAGNLAEGSRGWAGVRPVPVGVVERIVLFPAELELGALIDLELFVDGRVEIPATGTVVRVTHSLRVKRTVWRSRPHGCARRTLGLEIVAAIGSGVAAL